jgi:tRNA A37 threonylcarbamoyladenosine dehydratase
LSAVAGAPAVDTARFGGVARLYGADALPILARAHVAVIGVGGVGSWAAEALARTGIGMLTLIDADDICVSNTNRQLFALDGAWGRSKVAVLAERLRLINPALVVDEEARFLTPSNLGELLARDYTYVLDACDAFRVKVELIYWCRRNRVPVLTVGAAGGRSDPRQITVRDLAHTEHDLMLALVRRKLRDEFGWTRNPKRYFGVPAVYSLEHARYPQADGSIACAKPASMEEAARLDCDGGLGAAMHVTAGFAMVAVAELVERLLGMGRGLRPR